MAKQKTNNGIRKVEISFGLISIGVLLLDQISKQLVIRYVAEPLTIIRNFIDIHVTTNTGISFGLFQNTGILPMLIAVIIIIGIFYYYPKIPKKNNYQVLTALILGGAVGNFLDRILYGYVIDFIDIWIWPAFNVADSAITIGALGLMYLLWNEK